MARVDEAFVWEPGKADNDRALDLAGQRNSAGEYPRNVQDAGDEEAMIRNIAAGYIGDFAFQEWAAENDVEVEYTGLFIAENYTDDYDFRVVENGTRIDVKNQPNDYYPKDSWNCEIAEEQALKPMDILVFGKTQPDGHPWRIVRLVGWMTASGFLDAAESRDAGQPFDDRNVVIFGCRYVAISALEDMGSLPARLRVRD